MSGWGNIAKAKGLRLRDKEDLLEALERYALEVDTGIRPKVLRLAAERVRTRILTEGEARVISRWLLQLADGGTPIPARDGPKRKDDDHLEIAWIVKTNIELGNMKKGEAYRLVAEKFGLSPGTVRNICKQQEVHMPKSAR